MEKKTARIWSLIKDTAWAIKPDKLDEIISVIEMRIEGVEIPYEAAAERKPERRQGIGVLPLYGLVGQRMNMMMKFSGGTSTELFGRELNAMIDDPEIGGVLIDIDSPGGSVFGVTELAEEIYRARNQKPIWAVANSQAASAAYWIGAAVEHLAVTPSGEVGSIGVYAVHKDFSESNAKQGIKTTYIKAGRFKTASNPDEPLDEEARDYLQSGVDRYYDLFTGSVAKYRGKTVEQVKNGFGEGGMVGAREAVKIGMADRVATLEETALLMHDTINGKNKAAAKALQLDPGDEARRAKLSFV